MIHKLLKISSAMLPALAMLVSCASAHNENARDVANPENVVVAYVTSWTDEMPDPKYVTHINYAFGHVNDTFDGINVDNPDRLKEIVGLKESAPDLKVVLSIGGWGSGRFSEMAADSVLRGSFAADAARTAKEFKLDGIDIDWEYPGSDAAGISASPDDTSNFTLLMRDLRAALGEDALLTAATVCSAEFIDFPAILPYIDFINIMAYDMGNAPLHHSALYAREGLTNISADEVVRKHIAAGVPAGKLTLGIPFYGRGSEPYGSYVNYSRIEMLPDTREMWDSIACAPYMADEEGRLVLGFENARSAALKCQYAVDNGLRGIMYWDYSGDDAANTLRSTVYDNTMKRPRAKHVLVLSEGAGQHYPFSKAAMEWLRKKGEEYNFSVTELNHVSHVTKPFLTDYDLVIQLDFPPYTWNKEGEEAFIEYIDKGLGSWIGFHHATLLGEFDGYPMWDWFSDFMGGIRFRDYIAPLADGTVVIENAEHPVMAGLPEHFVIPDDEWYTYDVSPRPNVEVLATVDEDTYTPASEVRMGDHPVVWTNPSKAARNVYIQMGHSPRLLETPEFTKLFENSILWALE